MGPITSHNIEESQLLSLPSMICAYIISFCNMMDRIKFELISKDFNKLSKIPIANNDLIVDAQFAQSMVYKKMNISKYHNPSIKHLDLKFIFSDYRSNNRSINQFE